MKKIVALIVALSTLCTLSDSLQAFQHHTEKALWIETREHGKLKTTLAVTENIARMVIDSKDTKVNFSGHEKKDLITKDMVRSVLDEKEESVSAKDPDHDRVVTMSMKNLDVPGEKGGSSSLVLQTFKAGKKTFGITLPDIEVESEGDNDSDTLVTKSFGWKAFLPFLAKTGGALYVKNEKDDSEVWFYVE